MTQPWRPAGATARDELPLIPAILLIVVLGTVVLACYALDDLYRYARRGYRRVRRRTPAATVSFGGGGR
jgi:uncharacterized integral membrane protein